MASNHKTRRALHSSQFRSRVKEPEYHDSKALSSTSRITNPVARTERLRKFFDLKLRQQISRRFQKFRPEVAADAAANVGPKERLLHSNADAMDQTQDYCNSSAAIFWSDKGTGNSTVAVSQLQETAMADCHDSTPVFAGGLINRYDAYCTIMFKQPALPQSIDSAGNTHPLASSAEQQFLLRAGQTTPPTSPYETIMPGTGANIAAGTNAAAALSFNSPSINQQFPFTASQITPPTSPYGIATTNTAAGQRFTLPPTPYISTNQSMPPNTVGTMNTFATKPASDLGVNGNDLRYTRAMSPSTMPDAIAVEPWALTTHDTSAFGSFDDFVDMAQASVTVGNFEVDLVSRSQCLMKGNSRATRYEEVVTVNLIAWHGA